VNVSQTVDFLGRPQEIACPKGPTVCDSIESPAIGQSPPGRLLLRGRLGASKGVSNQVPFRQSPSAIGGRDRDCSPGCGLGVCPIYGRGRRGRGRRPSSPHSSALHHGAAPPSVSRGKMPPVARQRWCRSMWTVYFVPETPDEASFQGIRPMGSTAVGRRSWGHFGAYWHLGWFFVGAED
jgi:hypothetical protein